MTKSSLDLQPVDCIDTIEYAEFQQNYFRPLKPLVIKTLSAEWPATTLWTPTFFKEKYGHNKVTVYDKTFITPGKGYMGGSQKITLAEYIDKILTTRQDLRLFLYNITSHIPELLNDIKLPSIAKGFSKKFVFMFFGCRDSVTQMHFDIDMSHVFHTALYGKKTVTLFAYDQSSKLHRAPFTCRSYVDVDNPDFDTYPGLKKVKGFKVTLDPGDTLFIPSGYWHHMVYDEAGYALSLRCSNPSLKSKLHGVYNLTFMQSVDRLMNFIIPNRWHNWKQNKAKIACFKD